MIIKAYAKINLSLALTGIREDGYHTIHTVMQTVSLHDVLTVERAETIAFCCNVPSLSGENNLCVKAARKFFATTGIAGGATIELQKNIPTGAGLGGGSADAAAVLTALNELYGTPLSMEELLALGTTLGADVPFCIHGGKCLCTGIGEVLTPLESGEPVYLVIAKGKDGLSTPEMYRRMDAVRETWSSPDRQGYYNDFQAVAESVLPDVAHLRHRLADLGAEYAMMTGSGSAVFGIYANEAAAQSSAEILQEEGFFASSCVTL
jgi:4-diphosphocytidyl-2-C-methyl-D-erythritol kinase